MSTRVEKLWEIAEAADLKRERWESPDVPHQWIAIGPYGPNGAVIKVESWERERTGRTNHEARLWVDRVGSPISLKTAEYMVHECVNKVEVGEW